MERGGGEVERPARDGLGADERRGGRASREPDGQLGVSFGDAVSALVTARAGVATDPVEGDGEELNHVREEGAESFDGGRVGSRSLGGSDGVGSEEAVGEDEDARGAKRAGVHEEEFVEAETKSHKLTQIVRAETQGGSQVHHRESLGGEEAGACPGRARVRRRRAVSITYQGVRVSGVDNKVM